LYYLHRSFARYGKRDPTETAFSLKIKKSAGEISKMQRFFLAGRSGQTCPLGGGACAFQAFSSK
jgi:hypothetical protein